jgi:hypothetical protein
VRAERIRRHKYPVYELTRQSEVEVAPKPSERPLIRVVLAFVLVKVAAGVFDIELRISVS